MSDEKYEKTSEKINAVANLAKAIPVYDDALKPVMKETGKALSTVGRAVNVALAPIRGFVWGAEQIENWLSNEVARKLEGVAENDIVTPDLSVAGPTIEALKFSGHKPELSAMFASLMANAMTSAKADIVHPSFVEFIKEMNTLDARIFAVLCDSLGNVRATFNIQRQHTGAPGVSTLHSFLCDEFVLAAEATGVQGHQVLISIQAAVENLARLGLVSSRSDTHLTAEFQEKQYEKMKQGQIFKQFEALNDKSLKYTFEKSYVQLTQLGKNFKTTVFSK